MLCFIVCFCMRQANIRMQADALKIREPKPGLTPFGPGVCKHPNMLLEGFQSGSREMHRKELARVAKWRVRVQDGVSSPVP